MPIPDLMHHYCAVIFLSETFLHAHWTGLHKYVALNVVVVVATTESFYNMQTMVLHWWMLAILKKEPLPVNLSSSTKRLLANNKGKLLQQIRAFQICTAIQSTHLLNCCTDSKQCS